MRAGFAVLVLAYVLSQFYRAFLAVLSPVLGAEIGATATDLALASGAWFAVFAVAQLPIGWGLDRLGPRRTAAWPLILGGGGGAALFAMASTPGVIVAAMALIGLGCAPVLMASFYLFARGFPPSAFASLAGLLIGVGSAGNIASAAPLAWAADAFGWRASVGAVAGLTVLVGAALLVFVRDPVPEPAARGGGTLDLLRIPALWVMVPLLIVNYAPAAGVRGLWAGPYLEEVFGLDAAGIGLATLAMGGAMILGNFAYGPADRLLGTRKRVLVAGNLAAVAALFALGLAPGGGPLAAGALLASLGFFGSSFPLVMAHARSYYPAHLIGRGVTLANFLAIGGVGVLQIASARVHAAYAPAGPEAAYGALFLFFGGLLLAGVIVYLFAEDRLD